MALQRRHNSGTHHFIRYEERCVRSRCSIESDGFEEVSFLFARGVASSLERLPFYEYYERDGCDTEYDETVHEEGIIRHGNRIILVQLALQIYFKLKNFKPRNPLKILLIIDFTVLLIDYINLLQLHTHTTLDTVAKFLPVDILPNEAGGKAGPLMQLHEKSVKMLEDNRDWFLEEEQTRRVNESLRAGKGKTATDLFGVEGTFKKLDID